MGREKGWECMGDGTRRRRHGDGESDVMSWRVTPSLTSFSPLSAQNKERNPLSFPSIRVRPSVRHALYTYITSSFFLITLTLTTHNKSITWREGVCVCMCTVYSACMRYEEDTRHHHDSWLSFTHTPVLQKSYKQRKAGKGKGPVSTHTRTWAS